MAGRGVDIILGGQPPSHLRHDTDKRWQKKYEKEHKAWQKEHDEVLYLGDLCDRN